MQALNQQPERMRQTFLESLEVILDAHERYV